MYHIIDLGSQIGLDHDVEAEEADSSRAFLCTASLVCSHWRDHSQKRLVDYVVLGSNGALRSFLLFCTATQRLATRRVRVVRRTAGLLDGQLVEAVLARCHKVEELRIQGVSALKGSALCCQSLKGLKHLSLVSPLRFNDRNVGSSLPFSLDTITVNAWGERQLGPLPLIARLMSSSAQSATILLGGDSSLPSIPIALPHTPIVLTEVSLLHTCKTTSPGVDSILPFLRRCRRLKSFTTNYINVRYFDALPEPLSRLTLEGMDDDWLLFALDLLSWKVRSLSKLDELRLEYIAPLSPEPLDKVGRKCAERDVHLLVEKMDHRIGKVMK